MRSEEFLRALVDARAVGRSRLIRNRWRNFYMRHCRNIFAGFRTVAR
jgi:hypothetical protein